jgi:hypothetical protein
MQMNTKRLVTVFLVTFLILAMLPLAVAAKGGPPGGGGGGETTLTNNLSVPTIMIGGGFTGVACGPDSGNPSTLISPSGNPSTGYEIDPTAYYYVQGVSKCKLSAIQPIQPQQLLNGVTIYQAMPSSRLAVQSV